MEGSKKMKAFVRFDGSGRVIPGSLVIRKTKPKVGVWQELKGYECASGTKYQIAISGAGAVYGTATYKSPIDNSTESITLSGTTLVSATVCAVKGSVKTVLTTGTAITSGVVGACTCSGSNPAVLVSNTTSTTIAG